MPSRASLKLKCFYFCILKGGGRKEKRELCSFFQRVLKLNLKPRRSFTSPLPAPSPYSLNGGFWKASPTDSHSLGKLLPKRQFNGRGQGVRSHQLSQDRSSDIKTKGTDVPFLKDKLWERGSNWNNSYLEEWNRKMNLFCMVSRHCDTLLLTYDKVVA